MAITAQGMHYAGNQLCFFLTDAIHFAKWEDGMLNAEKLSVSYILLKNCVMLETKWRCWTETELIYSQFNQDISQNKPSVFVIWISFSAQRSCFCSRPQFHKIWKKKND